MQDPGTPSVYDPARSAVGIEHLNVGLVIADLGAVSQVLEGARERCSPAELERRILETDLAVELLEALHLAVANPTALRLFGARDLHEFQTRFEETLLPGTLLGLRTWFAAFARGERTIETRNPYRRLGDDQLVHFQIRSRISNEPSGPIAVTTIADVSGLVRLQHQLERSRERHALAIEATRLGMWELDVLQMRGAFSRGYHELLGLPDGSLNGPVDLYQDLVHPEDRKWSWDRVEELCAGTTNSLEKTYRLRGADGVYRWYLCRGKVSERNADGVPIRALGSLLEVDAQVCSERMLRLEKETLGTVRASNNLASALEHLARGIQSIWPGVRCAINLHDPKERVLSFGAAPTLGPVYAEALREFPVDAMPSVCGRAIEVGSLVAVPDLRKEEFLAPSMGFYESLGVRGCWSVPVIVRDRALATCCIFTLEPRSPSPSESLQLEHLAQTIGVLLEEDRQATQRATFEAQVRTRDRLQSLGKLAGGVAHDFNNLLTIIQTNAEMLQLGKPEFVAESVDQILNATSVAADLCRKMLTYAGSSHSQPERVDLSEVAREISGIVASGSPANVRFRSDLANGLPPVLLEPAIASQLVMNLVTNAVESIDGDGTVTIETGVRQLGAADLQELFVFTESEPGAFVYLQVSDTGVGIEPEFLPKIFDPFFSTKPDGRGLGLATVFGAVTRHQGGVGVHSTSGEGTTFTVYLPAAQESIAEIQPTPPKLAPAPRRVAIVDDEDAVRSAIGRMLELLGFSVLSLPSGDEALARADEVLACELVLLDQQMPGTDGLQTYRALRGRSARLPICVMSGYSTEQVVGDTLVDDPFGGLLDKPFSTNTLLSTIRSMCDRSPGAALEERERSSPTS